MNKSRQHWVVVAAALIAVGAATAAAEATSHAASSASGAHSAPTPSTNVTHAQPAGPELQFGIDYSDTLPFESPSQLATSLDDATAVGAQWIRIDLGWEDYQPFATSAPDFTRLDDVVAAANARNLKLLVTLGYPPKWARQTSCAATAACPPASVTEFAQFAREVATRYAPKGLHGWEIWNEPNIAAWAPGPDPAAYTALLTATAKAIRKADPHADILLGGLAAQQPAPGAPYLSVYDFLTAVGQAGGLKSVDGVGYHPYPTNGTITASAPFQAISSAPKNIVEALAEQGAGQLPIWITETGADVIEENAQHPDPAIVRAQTQTQTRVATDLVPVLGANRHVAAMFWFSDHDGPTAALHFGLRSATGEKRPSFAALQAAITAYEKQYANAK